MSEREYVVIEPVDAVCFHRIVASSRADAIRKIQEHAEPHEILLEVGGPARSLRLKDALRAKTYDRPDEAQS